MAWELASLLRRKRFEHGSLDLDFPEVKVVVDKKGKPIRLERIENDESHQLIEEFMLAANEAVARELKNRGIPTIYRVHENPDPEKLGEFREFVLAYGIRGRRSDAPRRAAKTARIDPRETGRASAQDRAAEKFEARPLRHEPLGHYGLAKNQLHPFHQPDPALCRSRGPSRAGRSRYLAPSSRASSQLSAIADHISDTERNAAEAEIDAVKMKKLEFFELQLEARDPQVFDAIVIDVRNYGLLVELPDILLTGLIHVSSLTDDFYVSRRSQRRFVGRQSPPPVRRRR